MLKNLLIVLFVSLVSFQVAIGQNGTIRGTVIDDELGDPVMFATVFVPETSGGTTTDLDGAFSLSLPPGSYSVEISYVGYSTFRVSDVIVTADQVTPVSIRLQTETEILKEVVVEAKQLRNTEAALATIKRKSVNVIDGISSASFKKMGDGNAAAAVKRVPGVSIQGGKYVFVRGLGDRYTKSILNGMDIPGLDPDRNTLQMDIFPTNILDNIIVLKSFTANLPADFTGGVVDISLKDFPEEKTESISAGLGFNPDMHFNDQYLNYEGGATDFLGFDDGTRDIPIGDRTDFPDFIDAFLSPNSERGRDYFNILSGFNPRMAAMRSNSFMDFSLGYSRGNQINKEKVTLGYNFAITYKNSTEFYEGVEFNRYARNNSSEINEMEQRQFQKGDLGANNVIIGGLGGFSIKTSSSKYGITLLHLQNGQSKAGIFDFIGNDQGASFEAIQQNLEYSERQLTNLLLHGVHTIKDGLWKLDWKLSPTRSALSDPDIRFTRYQTDRGGFIIGTESGIPERIWRDLEEYNASGRVDLTRKITLFDRDSKLKFGVGQTYKDRSYEIRNFQIFPGDFDLVGDPDELFKEENLMSLENLKGTSYRALFDPNENPNKFDANINYSAVYVSSELEPLSSLKAIMGVRLENFIQRYTGINQDELLLDNKEVINDFDLFPSLNLIYALTDKQNLRFSVSKTIARPSMKEASFATIIDPISDRTSIGAFFPDIDPATGREVWDGNIVSTDINNFDLRWETYASRGQTIALSAFYKTFKNPIEIVQYIQAPNNFQPRNVGDGQVLGVELEVRKNLGFISDAISNFSVITNVTVTDSKLEMSETEFNSRVANARIGESIDNKREMAGQAPYLINVGLAYQDIDKAWDAGLYYNVQGRTLTYVGIADRPDIYSVPFHNLKLTANKAFGIEKKFLVGFEVSNILGDSKEQVFESYGASDETFYSINPGRSFKLNFGYKFH